MKIILYLFLLSEILIYGQASKNNKHLFSEFHFKNLIDFKKYGEDFIALDGNYDLYKISSSGKLKKKINIRPDAHYGLFPYKIVPHKNKLYVSDWLGVGYGCFYEINNNFTIVDTIYTNDIYNYFTFSEDKLFAHSAMGSKDDKIQVFNPDFQKNSSFNLTDIKENRNENIFSIHTDFKNNLICVYTYRNKITVISPKGKLLLKTKINSVSDTVIYKTNHQLMYYYNNQPSKDAQKDFYFCVKSPKYKLITSVVTDNKQILICQVNDKLKPANNGLYFFDLQNKLIFLKKIPFKPAEKIVGILNNNLIVAYNKNSKLKLIKTCDE